VSFTELVDTLVSNDKTGLLGVHPSWQRVRLGEVASVLNGFAFPSNLFSPTSGKPLLRIRDVLSEQTEAFYRGEFDPEYLVRVGELVVGMDGDFNCAIWRGPEAVLNQRVCKITPDERFYSCTFLSYALPGYLTAINGATSSVTVKHLSSRTVEDIPLPLPPRHEQDRIVVEIEKQLTRLDAAVAALKRVQANLKRYRAAVLKAACEGRLVPTEAELARKQGRGYETGEQLLARILKERRAKWEADQLARMTAAGKPPKDESWKRKYAEPEPPNTTDLSGLPKGWIWASLDQLFVVERGRFSVRPRNDPRYYGGEHPFVQIGDLPRDGGFVSGHHQTLNEAGLEVSKKFPEGTVLIAIVGATIANTGVLNFAACCPDSLVGLTSDDRLLLRLVELYLRSIKLRLRNESYSSGGQPNINLALLLPLPVPLPPASEQRRIVAELDRQFSIVEMLGKETIDGVRNADRLRQAILKRAFEGKLAPQDPNDEPASVLLERIRAERAETRETPSKRPKNRRKRAGAAANA